MADNRAWVQAQKFKLNAAISSTATSITLQSFKLPDGSTNIVTADFGAVGYATLEPGVSGKEEHISFTTVTQNADGTATLSGVTRGLDFTAPYTEVSAYKTTHAAGSVFALSNTAAFYNSFANKENDETINGTYSFTAVPNSSAPPTSANDLATKTYVDTNVNGGAVSMDQLIVAGNAGETVAAGEIVYFDDTANEWKLADASAAATTDNIMMGIAQGAGTDGNAISGGVLLRGIDANQSGLTIGQEYFLSDTAGALSSSAGTVERALGWAKSATELYFDQYYNDHPSANEKAALVNLTQGDHQFAADAEASDTYVITLSPAPTAYTTGMVVRFSANTANTGAATINVNALGAKSIVKDQNVALDTGDILAGHIHTLVYDGTNFQLQSPTYNKIVVIGADRFSALNNATEAVDGANKVISFTDGVTGRANTYVQCPPGTTSISQIRVLYKREVAADVRLQFQFAHFALGSLPQSSANDDSAAYTQYTSSSADGQMDAFTPASTAHDGLSFVSNDLIGIDIQREGGNASDTYNAAWKMYGIEITFA